MKLWHRISLIIAFVALFVAGISNFLFSSQLESSLKAEDTRWSASLSQVLSRAIMRDTLEGKEYDARNLLRKIINDNDEISYLMVIDFENKPFVSTFDSVPEFLLNKNHRVCKEGEVNAYTYGGSQITDISNPLVSKLSAHVHLGISDDDLLETVNNEKNNMLFVVSIVSLIGILFGAVMSRRASRPIENLTAAVKLFGRNKEYTRIPLQGGHSEVNELVSSFDEMVEQRARYESEIYEYRNKLEELVKKRTTELENEIKQHEITEHRLELAKLEAERANGAKSAFLSQMSHELRTPLNAILGFSQLLQVELKDNVSQSDSVDEIVVAGEHLLKLITEVLDLSYIESGKLKISIEAVSWVEVVDESVRLLSSHAQKKNVVLNIASIQDDAVFVLADRLRLAQVTLNLLSNAIKYNNSGGRVDITLRRLPVGEVQLSVHDSGFGIAEKDQSRLFEAFDRLHFANSEIEGAGIGLFICKRIVEAMDGKIGFNSELGKGSDFWVRLPTLPESEVIEQKEKVRSLISTFDEDIEELKYVLYVEDQPANARLVSKIFSSIVNVELEIAATPREALDCVSRHKPDLVLLDIGLPGMNGYELKQKFDKEFDLAGVPMLAISANAMPEEIVKAKEYGFVDYIVKPFVVSELVNKVKSCLED